MLDDTSEAPPLVSPAVLSALVLVALWMGASVVPGLGLLHLLRLTSVVPLARLGEAPPAPPPRP